MIEREDMKAEDRDRVKKRNKARNKKLGITLVVEILVFVVLIVLYGIYSINDEADAIVIDDIQEEDIVMNDIKSENIDKYTTIALFGGDSRTSGTFGKGTHSDSIMIASINDKTKEVKIVSVYRDTYWDIYSKEDGEMGYNKANAAYFLGGPECAMSTLNANMDLKIKDYVIVDWKAITNAIDALGGVDVNIESNEIEILNKALDEQIKTNGIKSKGVYNTGMQHLNGAQATAYCRIRSTGQGDITRTERQREVMASMIAEAKQADLATLNEVVDEVFPQIGTSITKTDAIALVAALFKYELGETSGFPYQYVATSNDKGSVLVPADLENNVILLHKFLFDEEDYVPSDKVQAISDKISSGSGVGNNVTGTELDGLVNTQLEQ